MKYNVVRLLVVPGEHIEAWFCQTFLFDRVGGGFPIFDRDRQAGVKPSGEAKVRVVEDPVNRYWRPARPLAGIIPPER